MIVKMPPSLYRINLIRELREREKKADKRRRLTGILSMGCFGFFLLSLLYSSLTIWQMERVLKFENVKLNKLNQEYQKYKATRLIVDKKDIELLSGLQGRGIFWTKKISAMAKHLPENYRITRFSFRGGQFHVAGEGQSASNQDQLLTLDKYLNDLRGDTSFADIFNVVRLKNADRQIGTGNVTFEFIAYAANKKKRKGK